MQAKGKSQANTRAMMMRRIVTGVCELDMVRRIADPRKVAEKGAKDVSTSFRRVVVDGVRGTLVISLVELLTCHLSHQLCPTLKEVSGNLEHVRFQPAMRTLGISSRRKVGAHELSNQASSDGMIKVASSPSVSTRQLVALSCREVTQLRVSTGPGGVSGTVPVTEQRQQQASASRMRACGFCSQGNWYNSSSGEQNSKGAVAQSTDECV